MEGTFDSTRRAMTFTFAQSGSMVAIRATLARTAIIFDARSEPSAMDLVCIRISTLRILASSESLRFTCFSFSFTAETQRTQRYAEKIQLVLLSKCRRASSAQGEVESCFRYSFQSALASTGRDCFS